MLLNTFAACCDSLYLRSLTAAVASRPWCNRDRANISWHATTAVTRRMLENPPPAESESADPMRHYCTLFDRNYLERGLSLYRSLERHASDFKLHILCLDEVTHEALAALDLRRAELISITQLLDEYSDLRTASENRSAFEFYLTCKPALISRLLERQRVGGRLGYFDADLWFFSHPDRIEPLYASSPVALSPHRFDEANAWRANNYGRYNAGWISVAASEEGRRFAAWWRHRCIENCPLRPGNGLFADQKYLDQVTTLFPRAVEVAEPAINLGPWNIRRVHVELTSTGVQVDGMPLVCFHFHGTRRMLFNLHDSGLYGYHASLTAAIRDGIYKPYVSELGRVHDELGRLPSAIRQRLAQAPSSTVSRGRELVRTLRAVLRRTAVASG